MTKQDRFRQDVDELASEAELASALRRAARREQRIVAMREWAASRERIESDLQQADEVRASLIQSVRTALDALEEWDRKAADLRRKLVEHDANKARQKAEREKE